MHPSVLIYEDLLLHQAEVTLLIIQVNSSELYNTRKYWRTRPARLAGLPNILWMNTDDALYDINLCITQDHLEF